jgi:hypothetical protein
MEPFVPCVILPRPTSFNENPLFRTAFSLSENAELGHDSDLILQLLQLL